MLRYVLICAVFLFGFVLGFVTKWMYPDEPPEFGLFVGKVQSEWNDDGREMTLTQDFAYHDPRGGIWLAPKNSVVNGASIPRVFWTLVGGPFEGRYRNASVVHDVACVSKTRPHQEVHRMFYEACRAGGVGQQQARLLYAAVARFGPRWTYQTTTTEEEVPVAKYVPVEETRQETDPVTGETRQVTVTVMQQVMETRTRSITREVPVEMPQAAPSEEEAKSFLDLVEQSSPTLDEISAYARVGEGDRQAAVPINQVP